MIECYISDIWKVLNAMYLVCMKYRYCIEQAVPTLFLCVHVHCTGQCFYYKIAYNYSLLFIKFDDNILPLLLYQELFHG